MPQGTCGISQQTIGIDMVKHFNTRCSLVPGFYAICRLSSDSALPTWLDKEQWYSVTHTSEELSIVCADHGIPADVRRESGWALIKVEGPLDFSLTGVLATLTATLAHASISVFAISTFDTDYLLVRSECAERALALLAHVSDTTADCGG
jgi:uncharacterized protein